MFDPHKIVYIIKNLSQVITSTTSTAMQNLVEIHPLEGFWANRLNITNFFLFIPEREREREREARYAVVVSLSVCHTPVLYQNG